MSFHSLPRLLNRAHRGLGALLALLLALLVTRPDPPWTWILVGGANLMVVLPLSFYPLSKTLWLAIDLAFRPTQPEDF